MYERSLDQFVGPIRKHLERTSLDQFNHVYTNSSDHLPIWQHPMTRPALSLLPPTPTYQLFKLIKMFGKRLLIDTLVVKDKMFIELKYRNFQSQNKT